MHSSGMRTARLVTISQYALCRGVCIPACTGRGCIPACTGWGCIPACTEQGGCISKHALGRGGVYPSMHWAGGVYAQGVSAHTPRADTTPGRTRPL